MAVHNAPETQNPPFLTGLGRVDAIIGSRPELGCHPNPFVIASVRYYTSELLATQEISIRTSKTVQAQPASPVKTSRQRPLPTRRTRLDRDLQKTLNSRFYASGAWPGAIRCLRFRRPQVQTWRMHDRAELRRAFAADDGNAVSLRGYDCK